MKDYLSNLSARSFDLVGDLPIVSPRLSSIFEPQQPAPGMFDEVVSAIEVPPDGSGEVVDQMPLRHTEQIAGKLSENDWEPVPGSSKEHPLPQDREDFLRQAQDTPSAALLSPASMQPQNVSSADIRTPPSPETRSAAEAIWKEESKHIEKRLPQHTITGPLQPQKAPTTKGMIVREVRAESVRRPALAGTDGKGQHIGPTPMAVGLLLPATGPVLSTATKADNRGSKESESPIINVTIGRIEVRTTAPTAQTRPRAKDAAPMSLDEYLRHRTRGRAQ
jgi:hypothetical protein